MGQHAASCRPQSVRTITDCNCPWTIHPTPDDKPPPLFARFPFSNSSGTNAWNLYPCPMPDGGIMLSGC